MMSTNDEHHVEWLIDKKGPLYRCKIGDHEYIRTNRKERKPPKLRVAKIFSPKEKEKRRVYMLNYRKERRDELVNLQRQLAEARANTATTTEPEATEPSESTKNT